MAVLALVSSVLLLAGEPSARAATAAVSTAPTLSPPPTIPADCSSDVTTTLNQFFAGLPEGATVELPPKACYLTQGTVSINGKTGITIHGNGARLVRTQGQLGVNWLPHLNLSRDTSVSIDDLGISGTYVPGVSPGGHEGHYGIVLQQDHGINLTGLRVYHVSGDFIILFPAPPSAPNQSLDRGIQVTRSSFVGAGYHGVTVEAADGAVFQEDTFEQIYMDSIDLEYDIYPTVFQNGVPTRGAEDNVAFDHDTWISGHYVWFASLQGQKVQENNVRLTDNRLENTEFTVQVKGNQQVPNDGLVIAGNSSDTPTGGAPNQAGIILTGVKNASIRENDIPFFDGTPTYFPDHPSRYVLNLVGSTDVTAIGNDFSGAKQVVEPLSLASPGGDTAAPAGMTVCDNRYWVDGDRIDAACAVPGGGLSSESASGIAVSGSTDGSRMLAVTDGSDEVEASYRAPGDAWPGLRPTGGASAEGPALVSTGAGRYEAFAVGHGGALWVTTCSAGTWSAWVRLGGRVSAQPAAVADGSEVDVVVRGGDGGVWEKRQVDGGWKPGWVDLGGRLEPGTGPAATVNGSGDVVVYATGTNRAIWQYRQGSWSSLGGQVKGGPAAVSPRPGYLEVFGRSSGGAVWRTSWQAGRPWSGWRSLGGSVQGGLAAVAFPGTGTVAVYGSTGGGDLWRVTSDQGIWGSWGRVQ